MSESTRKLEWMVWHAYVNPDGYLGLVLSDVGHLDGLLAQLPLIPKIVWVEVALDEVHRRLDILIEHKLVLHRGLSLHDLRDDP